MRPLAQAMRNQGQAGKHFKKEKIMNTTMTMNAGYQTTEPTRGHDYTTAIARAKFVAMLVAAPLIGLAAVTLLPLAGLVMILKTGFKVLPQRVRDVALFLAAPFIGLAYLAAFPLIGIGALAYAGVQAARGK